MREKRQCEELTFTTSSTSTFRFVPFFLPFLQRRNLSSNSDRGGTWMPIPQSTRKTHKLFGLLKFPKGVHASWIGRLVPIEYYSFWLAFYRGCSGRVCCGTGVVLPIHSCPLKLVVSSPKDILQIARNQISTLKPPPCCFSACFVVYFWKGEGQRQALL